MNRGSRGVRDAMAKATAVEDVPFDPSKVTGAKPRRRRKAAESETLPPHGSDEVRPDDGIPDLEKLTPAQWKILEGCARYDENDVGNANRLLDWFGDRVLNVQEAGWHGWTGTHWDVETGQYAVERFAQLVSPLIKREAALIEADPDELLAIAEALKLKELFPDARKRPVVAEIVRVIEGVATSVEVEVKDAIKRGEAIAKAVASRRAGRFQFGIKTGDRARTKAMIDQAEPHRSELPRIMDSDDFALNTMSGTLRFARQPDPDCPDPDAARYIVTRRLDPHDPADLITKVTAARYVPKATAPNFLRDLKRFMPETDTREFLQVFIGYCALGVTGEQVYAFFYGDGQNWKSMFTQTIGKVFGIYAKPMMYSSISGQNTPSGDKPSPDWARLPGVRYLTIEEVPRAEPLKEELIKMVTSGSDMPVRHLNKGLFDMAPKFTAIMISNAEPNIKGADTGIWRRTLIVHWEEKVPDAEKRPFDQVLAMYVAEREGILNWIVEGIEKYLAHGLQPFVTDKMRAFTESVRRDRDAVGAYVDDCVRPSAVDGHFVTSRRLYQGFKSWCAANGIDPMPSETSFGLKIKRVPVEGMPMEKRKRSLHGVKIFIDIELHDVPDDDQPPSYRGPAPPDE